MSVWTWIKGGWRTYGPNSSGFSGAFNSHDDPLLDPVSAQAALKLSAAWGCVNLRAETIGSLPIHLRDADKKEVTDIAAYDVLHYSPNAYMTPSEFWSLATAHIDLYGNAISIITRRRDGSVISLEPVDPMYVQMIQKNDSSITYKVGSSDTYTPDQILHLRGFSMNAGWGLSRIEIGRDILGAQISANKFAQRAFAQGLKVGGFFEVDQNLNEEQLEKFHKRLDAYARPENANKWMALLKGFKPIGGAQFNMKAADAELLASRYFGIEEICRLFNTPPQLIGHTDKASSWASSLEMVNLYFLMYSLQPTFVRMEQRIAKSLLTTADRARGIVPKFNIQALLRADSKTQQLAFASGLQNGYYSQNDVLNLLDRPGIGPDGDIYRVQMNMSNANPLNQQGA